ncbi:hypothetical protein CNMCM5793_006667 [Aspergillus hiratsukae]|uniref:Uncharacterized protein n=1 Tax=Aspergillus hiratsukae TaxID=1194566 RepID=A0A8H6UH20_9EURO|nr:hypothetical protein CNMCM5793_006667 [Aspergillus hiratsukae]
MTLISQSTTIPKDLLNHPAADDWTPEKQDAFTNYLGQSIAAWGAIAEKSLRTLSDGSGESIEMLTELISDGKVVEGSGQSIELAPTDRDNLPKDTASALQASIGKLFFDFFLPSGPFPAGTHSLSTRATRVTMTPGDYPDAVSPMMLCPCGWLKVQTLEM